jgi:hypothetical protein
MISAVLVARRRFAGKKLRLAMVAGELQTRR